VSGYPRGRQTAHTRPRVAISRDRTAEVVAALAVTYPARGSAPAGRYPAALRAEAAAVSADIGDDKTAASLAADVHRAGLGRVLSALVSRDVAGCRPDAEARRVLEAVSAVVPDAAPIVDPEGDERIRQMHVRSRYDEAPGLGMLPGIRLWPVRLLTPAPAGKLFAKGIPAGEDLRLVFGDSGQIGLEESIDWLQWYRLGVWHALLAAGWSAAVQVVAGDDAVRADLDAAFGRIPEHALYKVGVHETTVSRFGSWQAYFTDAMISAGKVVLETAVAGPGSGADQLRWLRSLGRVHLEWFVTHLAESGVERLSPAALARAWLADAATLRGLEPVFCGPLAACESPLWASRAELVFSPSVDRLARRALSAWLRTQWPGRVEAREVGDPRELVAPGTASKPRLVFALAGDEEWVAALEQTLSPRSREWWRRSAGAAYGPGHASGSGTAVAGETGRGVLFAARGPGSVPWSRVSMASDADHLMRLQQVRRPFADWTAVGGGPAPCSGRLRYEGGLPALEPPGTPITH
jgi:hypothetical protein